MPTREYLEIPPAERIKAHKIALRICDEKIRRLEAEASARGSTAWLARRQLPMKRRDRAAIKRLIERAEAELKERQS